MRREGLLAWLIVFAALALPSGSLYVWLTGTVDAAHHQEQTVKRQRETPIFTAPRLAKALVNPVVRQPEVRVHEEEQPLPEPSQVKAPEPPKRVPSPASAPVAQLKPEPAAKPAPILAADWAPRRNPMLSPREQAIMSAPIPVVDAPAPMPVARRARRIHAKPIQDTVSVEAIIALAGEASAIVNGTAVKVGDMVGRLKVVMITGDAVTFAYGATRFVKAL